MVRQQHTTRHQQPHRCRQERGLFQEPPQHQDGEADRQKVLNRLDELQEGTQRLQERPDQVR